MRLQEILKDPPADIQRLSQTQYLSGGIPLMLSPCYGMLGRTEKIDGGAY
jgi:hypothetical protein